MDDFRKTYGYHDPYTQPLAQPPVESKKSWHANRKVWIAGCVIAALLTITIPFGLLAFNKTNRTIPELPPPRNVSSADFPSPAELSKSFRFVAKTIKPAVVYIQNTEPRPEQRQGDDSFPFPFGHPQVPDSPRPESSAGSGVIVTADGYILTNNHVIENAGKMDVTLADGRKFRAKLIGSDKRVDLAVVKIDAESLPTAVLGDSDAVEQGDWVLALGSPFGLQQTLTAGIVSATGREINGAQFSRYIQTDASINPGNSGGPLVNMSGEVIGINTMIISSPISSLSRGNVGIGFAITSNTAREIFTQIVKTGRVSHGYLGVSVRQLDEATAKALKVEPNVGVLVRDIPDPNMPAGKAGIQSGDIITAINGKAVHTAVELTEAIASNPAGKSVTVEFLRDGQKKSVSVELVERPEDRARLQPTQPQEEPEGPARPASLLGITANELSEQSAQQLNLQIPSGVVVAGVSPNSPAARAGITPNDVIHKIGGKRIQSLDDFTEATKSLRIGDEIALQIEKGGRLDWVTVNLE